MSVTQADPWLDTPEAVEYLRTSKTSLYRRVQMRKLRFTKDGNQLRFRKSWLDEYLRENERAPVEVRVRTAPRTTRSRTKAAA